MSWLDGVRARLRPLLRRSTVEREIEDEFAFHLEREVEKHLAAGMSPEAARRAARLSFGGGDRFREEVRQEWTGVVLGGLGQDLRRGVRRLVVRPGFAIVAVLTLGLGIGASTAVFSLVRSVLLEPLPYAEPERLVMLWRPTADHTQDTWLSEREAFEYADAVPSFERLGAYARFDANLTEGEPERVRAAAVMPDLFGTLGVPALLGRTFAPEEDVPGQDAVVLLGHGLWQRRFGGAADVLGREIRVNGQPRTVVGVMPPHFRLPLDYGETLPTELWVPAAVERSADLPWGDRSYFVVARLVPGASAERATADMMRAHAAWAEQGHIQEGDLRNRAAVTLDALLLGNVRPALWILFGAVGLLLLIACANVAHLLLARADARRREIATLAALGASRFRIARQLVVESALLAGGGAALGVAVAYAGLRAALAFTPVDVVRMRGVTIGPGVLGFAALLAVVATLLAGLAPALRLSRVNVASAMAASRGDVAPMRRGVRRLLLVSETSLSLVLVLGAALLARSFAELRRVDLGFEPRGVLTVRVDLPRADYPEPAQVVQFYRELVQRVAALPGVASAGAVRVLPLAATIGNWSLTIEGRPQVEGEDTPADWQVVTPGYIETMGIELLRGRTLTDADHEDGHLVAVINETMAARYWPGQDALGRRFHLGGGNQPWVEVVGITRDVRRNGVLDGARAEMYMPHAQWVRAKNSGPAQYGMTLVLRTAGDPLALVPAVREQVRALDPNLPVSDVRTMDDVAASALAQQRFTTVLLGVFAALALALTATGLYGVVSFLTTQRTREIGVRVALGAERGDVTWLVLRDGLAAAVLGVAVGLAGSLWLTRLLAGQLYGVAPLDPVTFAAAPALLLAIAALASWLPARRAARVSPVQALREE